MKYVFVDTNGWIALANKRDQYHKTAVELNKSLPIVDVDTSPPIISSMRPSLVFYIALAMKPL